jgi:hypothetical protein
LSIPDKYLSLIPWAVLIIRELMHWIERRDLYTRIMSGSLPEYKGTTCKTHKYASPMRKNNAQHHEELLKR